jgi:hypothetical protein
MIIVFDGTGIAAVLHPLGQFGAELCLRGCVGGLAGDIVNLVRILA